MARYVLLNLRPMVLQLKSSSEDDGEEGSKVVLMLKTGLLLSRTTMKNWSSGYHWKNYAGNIIKYTPQVHSTRQPFPLASICSPHFRTQSLSPCTGHWLTTVLSRVYERSFPSSTSPAPAPNISTCGLPHTSTSRLSRSSSENFQSAESHILWLKKPQPIHH